MPNQIDMSIADKGDGTGILLTINDAGTDSDFFFFTSRWDGGTGGTAFTLSFSGEVNTPVDVVDVPLEPGQYWGYAQQLHALGELHVSRMFYFVVSSGIESVYYRCLQSTISRITSLGIEGLNIVALQKTATDRLLGEGRDYEYPACIVSLPFKTSESQLPGVNDRDDVGYPIQVTLLNNSNQDQEAKLPDLLKWREQIARAFRNQRLPGVDEIYLCSTEYLSPLDWGAFHQKNLDVSTLILRFISREVRGV